MLACYCNVAHCGPPQHTCSTRHSGLLSYCLLLRHAALVSRQDTLSCSPNCEIACTLVTRGTAALLLLLAATVRALISTRPWHRSATVSLTWKAPLRMTAFCPLLAGTLCRSLSRSACVCSVPVQPGRHCSDQNSLLCKLRMCTCLHEVQCYKS